MPAKKSKRIQRSGGTLTRGITMVAAGALLAACSQVPDAINPVEWYNSTVELFSGDDTEKAAEQKPEAKQSALAKDAGKPPPGSTQQYPTLSRVDQQADYEAARKKGGLVADIEGRQYAPAIARQGEPASTLAAAPPEPPKATATAPAQPAPPAMPATAVVSAEGISSAPAETASVGGSLPTTAEQQAFEMRLRKQLAEIQARAGQGGSALPSGNVAIPSMAPEQFGTVVISADGIQSGQQTAAMAAQPAGASASGGALSFMQRAPSSAAAGAVRVATIQFGNGSARLTANDRRILANVRQLQRERGGKIRIVGHASSRTRTMDPVKHKMVNFKVSVDRANVVARELMRLGFKKEQLVVDAVSDTSPLYHEVMPSGEAGNRRAEIYLES